MKNLFKPLMGLVIAYAVLALLQLWFVILTAEMFVKLSITFFVIAGVIVLVYALYRDFGQEDRLKKDKLVD